MKKARAGSDQSSPVELRVAEARHRDVGKRRARIDSSYMEQMGIQSGEVIELRADSSGTAWFSLQHDGCRIGCVIWANSAASRRQMDL